MKFSEITETFKISIDSMNSNKLRSFLASLGVVIGVSFVIIMGWVIGGLDSALKDTINLLGSDMLYVDQWDWAGGGRWKDREYRKPISLEQAKELCEKITTAELAIPLATKWSTTLKYANESYQGISALGTKSEYGLTPSGAVVEGRFFSPIEDRTGANVAVIGYGVYTTIFPNGNALNKIIKVNGYNYTVIGVVKKQATYLTDFMDQRIYIPLQTFVGTFGDFKRSFSIAVKAGNESKLDEVRAETQGLMRVVRNLKPGKKDDFAINETKAFEDTVKILRLVVWSIGIGMTVLSFIVGIIGIMNIMFVSVTERTKEIGIRKAIGAQSASILLQFIIESAALCFVGALIAFIGCSAVVFTASKTLPGFIPQLSFLKPYIPFDLLIISSVVSIFVGVLAGLIPATRAARMHPVDALRFE